MGTAFKAQASDVQGGIRPDTASLPIALIHAAKTRGPVSGATVATGFAVNSLPCFGREVLGSIPGAGVAAFGIAYDMAATAIAGAHRPPADAPFIPQIVPDDSVTRTGIFENIKLLGTVL